MDIFHLRAKWSSKYTTSTLAIELEIFNEGFNGNWTWNHADRLPTGFRSNGKIENGRIMYSWPGDQVDLSFRQGEGDMKLEGDDPFEPYQGTTYLSKVK